MAVVKQNFINFINFVRAFSNIGRVNKRHSNPNQKFNMYKNFFDAAYYLQKYDDIKAAKIDPLTHFIEHGEGEGRNPNSYFDTNYFNSLFNFELDSPLQYFLENDPRSMPKINFSIPDFEWNEFVTQNTAKSINEYRLYFVDLIDENYFDSIIKKVHQLSKYEPKLFAAGYDNLENLNITKNIDASARAAISLSFLSPSNRILSSKFDTIFIIDDTTLGGALIYQLEFMEFLSTHLNLNSCILVINENISSDFEKFLPKKTDIFYYRRYFQTSPKDIENIALLLSTLTVNYLFVCNSKSGFKCVQEYGVFLKNYMKIFSIFFSEPEFGLDGSMSARFMPSILKSSRVLSDNQAYLDKIESRIVKSDKEKLIKMPRFFLNPKLSSFHEKGTPNFVERVDRIMDVASLNIFWIGRNDPFKRLSLLNALCNIDINNSYFIRTNEIENEFSWPYNVNFSEENGLFDWKETSNYDIFIFTSQFEGMPNVVLEAALSGIPIITPAVGGITEIFDANDVFFYSNYEDDATTASEILAIIDLVKSQGSKNLLKRIESSYAKVRLHNDPKQYHENFKNFIGLKNE